MQLYYASRDGQARKIAMRITERLARHGVAAPRRHVVELNHLAGKAAVEMPLRLALDIASLPVYALRSSSGSIVQVTDPGHGLISGKWLDIGKVKVPILRGLAAHPPYFHNGSAKDLMALVEGSVRAGGVILWAFEVAIGPAG